MIYRHFQANKQQTNKDLCYVASLYYYYYYIPIIFAIVRS
jgi:hypothetical protein